jgi:hypothetical protein
VGFCVECAASASNESVTMELCCLGWMVMAAEFWFEQLEEAWLATQFWK